MRKEFKRQLLITVILVIVFSVLNTVFQRWIFSNIGYCLAGLLWILHPVPISDHLSEKAQRIECRIAGVILILLGLMLRAQLY